MFGKNLKDIRIEKGYSQSELAKLLGVAKSTISMWESGQREPDHYEKIEEIADILNVNMNRLVSNAPSIFTVYGNLYDIPIYENVSAGFGAAAVDSVIDYMPLPFKSRYEAEQTILIKVQGDSMTPKIEDGDLIQVHRQTSVDSGDLAVVILDGDNGLVKKVEYTDETVTLISLNLNYPPIKLNGAEVKRCQVVGKVKRIVREV